MNYYIHNLDPIAFSLFGMPFPWYWLAYFFGYFWVLWSLKFLSRRGDIKLSEEVIHSYIFFGFFALVLSGKAFYILFYNLGHYLENPLDILAIWKGGMSFHGALLGGAAWTLYYSRKKAISFWKLTDPLCMVLPLTLFFGRLANFVNGELAGRVTEIPWAVVFNKFYDSHPRHPSQIYEALLEGLLLFIITMTLKKKLKTEAVMSIVFLTGYGCARFFVEFYRMPDPQIGYILNYFSIGQVYCVLMIVLAGLIYKFKKN
ncbi:MAG: prolipoprotein diacylglyceryl transferase [Bacteriovorax sp. MedPE-SWde]|nr:MAG: prolipoprotein diacylglyceryl transferase [Bacteriovorax sp. MedPE-SWde]